MPLELAPLTVSPRPAHVRLAWQTGVALLALLAYALLVRMAQTEAGTRSGIPPIYAWFKSPPHANVWQALQWLLPIPLFLGWRRWMTADDGPLRSGRVWVALLPLAVLLMNAAVATTDGAVSGLVRPLDYPGVEFYCDTHFVQSTGQFLHDFVGLHGWLALHSRTHPPGPILFLHYANRLVPSIDFAAFATMAVTALTVIPVHLLARRLYGRRAAAIATGLYVVTPNLVLYGATSMDGVYTLPLLLSLYAFFRAVEAESSAAAVAWSVGTGLLMALSMLMTFSTVCLGMLLAAYGVVAYLRLRPWRRIWGVLLLAGAAFALAYVALYRATGYDLIAAVRASMESDADKMGPRRRALLPYLDVSVANLLAFAIGCGVVTSILWAKQVKATVLSVLRRQAVDPLLLSFAAAVVFLSFSTLYRFETERIWIFFAPLVLIAAAKQIAHAPGPAGTRKLFDLCLCALFVQTYLMQMFLFTLW